MTSRYKTHHPSHYPVGWNTAVKLAAAKRDSPEPWLSIDWARGRSGAIGRMKRLRAFREGLYAYKNLWPEVAAALAAGYLLTFRKVQFEDVWDVQVSWQKRNPSVREILGETLRTEVAGNEGEQDVQD